MKFKTGPIIRQFDCEAAVIWTNQEEHPLLQPLLGELVQAALSDELLQIRESEGVTLSACSLYPRLRVGALTHPARRRQVLDPDQVPLQLRQLLEVLQADEAALELRGDLCHFF